MNILRNIPAKSPALSIRTGPLFADRGSVRDVIKGLGKKPACSAHVDQGQFRAGFMPKILIHERLCDS